MDNFLKSISEDVCSAFEKAGYDKELGKVSFSNRPDLCEYQCNGAMLGAKKYKTSPLSIASEVQKNLLQSKIFENIEVVAPGFLNFTIKSSYLMDYCNKMLLQDKFGLETNSNPKVIVLDYGGPNVAKPLHVGHLRPAIIGESIKRIERYVGNKVIGDVHLGDWGLPMGLIITELKERKPTLIYFDDSFTGEYPTEPPFNISELEELYPIASQKSKYDSEYKNLALQATAELQSGKPGYTALWKHILKVSIADLKQNYAKLNVSFDLWLGESDASVYIPNMIEKMKKDGYAHISNGALVVDVSMESDKKTVPPCMLLKSDGASLYDTTDVATILQRVKDFNPDSIIYVVDKRQELHFEQVFRCAQKTKITDSKTELKFLGFGTMNGKDGKPFKTRDGGVMRLEALISQVENVMRDKVSFSNSISEFEVDDTVSKIALASIKYGDLSNQASKDYIFDIDKFTSFEGNTGPYILYTIVRINSILDKHQNQGGTISNCLSVEATDINEKRLQMTLTKFNMVLDEVASNLAPHILCAYVFELSNAFNSFYHNTRILSETNSVQKESWITLISLTKQILETCIDLLGFSAPLRM